MSKEELRRAVDKPLKEKTAQFGSHAAEGDNGIMVKYEEVRGYRYRLVFERDGDGRWNLQGRENIGRAAELLAEGESIAVGRAQDARVALSDPRSGKILSGAPGDNR